MSDYSVFKVQVAKKGTKCYHSLHWKGFALPSGSRRERHFGE